MAASAWRLSALVVAAFALSVLPAAREGSPASVQGPTASSFARLPLAAQAAISRTVGRDDPAYRVTQARGGFRATNRRQGLEGLFTTAGVRVRAGGNRLGLSLTGYGSGNAVRPASRVAPHVRANRIEYRRGTLTEWYANGPLGLEQGFTLTAPPTAERERSLMLALSLSGNLIPRLETSGQSVRFDGSSLRYTGLSASDATGHTLPAWLELHGRTLFLRVDARHARYPVEIDPFVQQAKLTASDGVTQDSFGRSVAISGDTIVVGAPLATVGGHARQGAAYAFVKPVSGWAGSLTEVAKLTASDGAASDQFGVSVAIAGDTVVAGAGRATVAGHARQGAAYVFVKPAAGWSGRLTENAKLTASGGAAGDFLGFPVAITGDTVVASASQATVGTNAQQGAVYVFLKPASGWSGGVSESAKLTASDGAATDTFGFGVAIAGDTIVAGADDASAAYVFVKPASGWLGGLTENAKLTASDGTSSDGLGFSVAIAGDTVVAGAYLATVGANQEQGAAYVFVKPAAGWSGSLTQSAKLTASDGTAFDMLGYSVAIADDTVVAGAPHRVFGSNPEQGAAYAFLKPASGWSGTRTEDAKLTASDGAPADFFGASVALAGTVGVVGSPRDDIFNNPGPGAAYVIDADATPPAVTVAHGPNDSFAGTGWYNRASSGTDGIEVDVSASDASGVTNITCADGSSTVLDTAQASGSFTLHDGIHSVSCTATDGRGNSGAGQGSTPMPVTFDVDETPPTLAPAVSPNPVFLRGTAAVAANASDPSPGSGLDSASVACGSLDTSSIGIKTVTCSASDVAGNNGQSDTSYTVQYRFLGFSSPHPSSKWKAGPPIPVRFALGDVNGVPISDSEAQAIANSCRAKLLLTGPDPSTATVAGPICTTYNAKANNFMVGLATPKSLSSGTYALVAQIYDTAQPPNLNATGSEAIKIKH